MTVKQALNKNKDDIFGQFQTKPDKKQAVADRKRKWWFWPVVILLVIFILVKLGQILG